MVNAVALEPSTEWNDCPFRASVPDHIEIHWGAYPGRLTFSLYSPTHDLWADSSEPLGPGMNFSAAGDVLPLVKALALACFDQEFPDELIAMELRRTERGKKGLPPPDEDAAAWLRYKDLGCEISAS